MHKTFGFIRTLCLTVMLAGAVMTAAQAQVSQPDTLPVEVQMLYMKMLNQTPDFSKIIYSNPEFQSSKDKFGQEAILNQQFRLLQKLYSDAGKSKPVYVSQDRPVLQMSKNARIVSFAPITPDEPILYPVDTGETFAIFIRNGDVLDKLAPPFEFDDFTSLSNALISSQGQVKLHMTLEPVAADPQPFALTAEQSVNVILVDITEIKMIDTVAGKLLLHKKLNDNNGLPVPTIVPKNRDYLPLPPATP